MSEAHKKIWDKRKQHPQSNEISSEVLLINKLEVCQN